ncbi:MAG: flagellar biosynthetic protein FlhB [Gemmatales bacterium]|nr:MAG: flagellar biosynthetic protein FlhB [Gemmatales bacterium]
MPEPHNRQAVALRYQPGQDVAPRVVAKGSGALAERIIQIAKENDVVVREDKNLVRVLSMLDLDQEIPPQLYKVVAEILAFVYRLSNRVPQPPAP